MKEKAYFHLPGLFEFYELYRMFLPLFREHREYFYDWCEIGSIYGAPADCIWGGGRAGFGENDPERFFRKGNQAVLILAVILLVFISPFVKGAVGGILTFAVGILLLPFWLIVGLGIGAVALLVGGLAAVVAGAGLLTVMIGTGIMTIGIGCLMIALAILMVLGLISVAVRIVPKWFRKITDFFNRVLYRKRKEAVK